MPINYQQRIPSSRRNTPHFGWASTLLVSFGCANAALGADSFADCFPKSGAQLSQYSVAMEATEKAGQRIASTLQLTSQGSSQAQIANGEQRWEFSGPNTAAPWWAQDLMLVHSLLRPFAPPKVISDNKMGGTRYVSIGWPLNSDKQEPSRAEVSLKVGDKPGECVILRAAVFGSGAKALKKVFFHWSPSDPRVLANAQVEDLKTLSRAVFQFDGAATVDSAPK